MFPAGPRYNRSVPIKVTGRFATASDTAKALGISEKRAKKLTALVDEYFSRHALAKGKGNSSRSRAHARQKASRVTVRRTRNGSTIATKASKAKS
jgi:hypothetical protein